MTGFFSGKIGQAKIISDPVMGVFKTSLREILSGSSSSRGGDVKPRRG